MEQGLKKMFGLARGFALLAADALEVLDDFGEFTFYFLNSIFPSATRIINHRIENDIAFFFEDCPVVTQRQIVM